MRKIKKKSLVLLVTIVLLFSTCSVLVAESMKVKTIEIGVIASTSNGYASWNLFFEEILEPDINDYCAKLPRHRFQPRVEFDFIVRDAEANAERHLELVQEFHEEGIDLIIGGGWSSMANYALDYVNDNGIILVSPSSTSPILAIPDDNLFRLCPDDIHQGAAIAEMLSSKGVDEIIIIYRDDAWGASLMEITTDEYETRGGTVLTTIGYPPDEEDFTSYLEEADEAAQEGTGTVAITLFSFSEAINILITAEDEGYSIYDLEWFGGDGTYNWDILGGSPEQAAHVNLYSTSAAPTYSSKFEEMSSRYSDLTGVDFTFYTSCTADAAWVLALSVLETRSTSGKPELLGTDVVAVFPDVASRYFGYSGWCLLNEAGDRYSTDYNIWGYGYEDEEAYFIYYGYYGTLTGEVYWE